MKWVKLGKKGLKYEKWALRSKSQTQISKMTPMTFQAHKQKFGLKQAPENLRNHPKTK